MVVLFFPFDGEKFVIVVVIFVVVRAQGGQNLKFLKVLKVLKDLKKIVKVHLKTEMLSKFLKVEKLSLNFLKSREFHCRSHF